MVSVIIINFNTFDYTERCIRSVYEKTHGVDFEIIIVNNSSEDKPIKLLNETFKEVRIIHPEHNLGFSKANNMGIDHAKGEYILLLNSDTELINDAITIASESLNDKRVGVVSSQLQYPNGNLQPACQSFPGIIAEILETTRLFKLFSKKYIAQNYMNSRLDLMQSHYCDWVWGTFFMIRKSDISRLNEGKLSDRFFMYGEDMEWCYQFKQIGLKVYYNAEAKIIHHLGKSNFGDNFRKTSTIIKNEILFMQKYKGYLFSLTVRLLKYAKFKIQSIKTPALLEVAKLYMNTSYLRK